MGERLQDKMNNKTEGTMPENVNNYKKIEKEETVNKEIKGEDYCRNENLLKTTWKEEEENKDGPKEKTPDTKKRLVKQKKVDVNECIDGPGEVNLKGEETVERKKGVIKRKKSSKVDKIAAAELITTTEGQKEQTEKNEEIPSEKKVVKKKRSAGKSSENIMLSADKKKRKAKKKKKLVRKNSSVEKIDDSPPPTPPPYEGPVYSDGEWCDFESFDAEGFDDELLGLVDDSIDAVIRNEEEMARKTEEVKIMHLNKMIRKEQREAKGLNKTCPWMR